MTSTDDVYSKLISIEDAARILKVHKETLRRWDNSGRLKAVRVGSRKDRKYRIRDVINAMDRHK